MAALEKLSPADLGHDRVLGRHLCAPCAPCTDAWVPGGPWRHGLYAGKRFGHSVPQVVRMSPEGGLAFESVEDFAGTQLHEVVYENGACLDPDGTMRNVEEAIARNGRDRLEDLPNPDGARFAASCKTGLDGDRVAELCGAVSRLCEDKVVVPFVKRSPKTFFDGSLAVLWNPPDAQSHGTISKWERGDKIVL